MDDVDVRTLFDTLLVAPAEDTTDIEEAIRVGRRRRQRRDGSRWLASAAALVLVGLGIGQLPLGSAGGGGESAGPPTASSPAASVGAGEGELVTDARQVAGIWRVTSGGGTTGGQVFGHGTRELVFREGEPATWWEVGGGCIAQAGTYTVTGAGEFVMLATAATLPACGLAAPSATPTIIRVAGSAHLVVGGGAEPRRLVIRVGDDVVGEYVSVPDGG